MTMAEASAAPEEAARAVGEALAARYRAIHLAVMRDLPISNPLLEVEAIGFRVHGGAAVGVLVAPWFMNVAVAALPGHAGLPAMSPGGKRLFPLPAGDIELTTGELEGFGRVDLCSLFSPMHEFDQDGARVAAGAALAALFEPAPTEPAEAPPALDRRAFLRGRIARREEARP